MKYIIPIVIAIFLTGCDSKQDIFPEGRQNVGTVDTSSMVARRNCIYVWTGTRWKKVCSHREERNEIV